MIEPLNLSERHYEGDLQAVATYFDPTEAMLMRLRLATAGIPSLVADTNLIQAHPLLVGAMGGVRLLVPSSYLTRAEAVIAACLRGDFCLDEDFDVGEPADDFIADLDRARDHR